MTVFSLWRSNGRFTLTLLLAAAGLHLFAPASRAAAIYLCANQDGINPGAIYQAGAGDENYSLVAALPGCGAGTSPGPGGSIAINNQSNIFQADVATGDIYEITPSGTVSTFASGLVNAYMLNLAFDSRGNLFVASRSGELNEAAAISEYTPGGVLSAFYSGTDPQSPADDPATLLPTGLAVDASGNVFVIAGGCIDEFTPGGSGSVFSCAEDGLTQLAFDGGTLFGGTGGFNGNPPSLYEFAPNGTASLFALDGTGVFTFDDSGNLFYVEDHLTIDEIPAGGGPATAFSTRIFPNVGPIVAEDATPEPGTLSLLFFGAGVVLLAGWFGKLSGSGRR